MFSLPVHQLNFAPWEYVIFLLDVAGSPRVSPLLASPSPSLPPITLYQYNDVLSGDNANQHVGSPPPPDT